VDNAVDEVTADEVAEKFAATGIDDALDLLESLNAKTDKAALGTAASGIERHPERRFKGGFINAIERIIVLM
jgi:hypothetical protein